MRRSEHQHVLNEICEIGTREIPKRPCQINLAFEPDGAEAACCHFSVSSRVLHRHAGLTSSIVNKKDDKATDGSRIVFKYPENFSDSSCDTGPPARKNAAYNLRRGCAEP